MAAGGGDRVHELLRSPEHALRSLAPGACLLRRENYDIEVWEQPDRADGGETDGGETEADVGVQDAGPAFDAPVPRILFVTITLHPGACDLGESPPTDTGGNYAIDTTTWRIVGWRQ